MTPEERRLSRLLKAQSEFESEIIDDVDTLEQRVSDLEKNTPDTHALLKTIRGPVGPQGPRGLEGPLGPKGLEGKEGKPGKDGKDGKDGEAGLDGIDGKDGKPGKKGLEGKEGKQGLPPKHEWFGTKLRFENPDGTWGEWMELGSGHGGQMFGATFDASSVTTQTGVITDLTGITTQRLITTVILLTINGQFQHDTSEFTFSGKRLSYVTPLDSSLLGVNYTLKYI